MTNRYYGLTPAQMITAAWVGGKELDLAFYGGDGFYRYDIEYVNEGEGTAIVRDTHTDELCHLRLSEVSVACQAI